MHHERLKMRFETKWRCLVCNYLVIYEATVKAQQKLLKIDFDLASFKCIVAN